jgi:triosephosphate isomerase
MLPVKKMVFFSNLKIYMRSRSEVSGYVEKIKRNLGGFNSDVLEVHIMADFLSFEYFKKNLSGTGIKIGVQDLFWEDSGSFAGEVSPLMLKDLGCDSVYIGHSERKLLFGENDENINRKVLAALRNKITPLMFIGETREELENGKTEEVLRKQLKIGLDNVTSGMVEKIIFIYEPRWAIGQKESAPVETIRTMHKNARSLLEELFMPESVKKVRILYGGSVNLENIKETIEINEVDGVGAARASIDPLNFIKLVKITETEALKRSKAIEVKKSF